MEIRRQAVAAVAREAGVARAVAARLEPISDGELGKVIARWDSIPKDLRAGIFGDGSTLYLAVGHQSWFYTLGIGS